MSDTDVDRLILDGRTVDANVRAAIESAELERTIDGASTITLGLRDPFRQLARSALFTSRVTATVDGHLFELVKVAKTGSSLTVTLEDATVADLRRLKGTLSAKAGTTTVDAFARRLIAGAAGTRLVAEPGVRNLAPLLRGSESEPAESSWEALVRLADERGRRVFVDRRTVYFATDAWLLKRVAPAVVREHTAGVDDVDFDADAGKPASDATITANAARWAAGPGTPVDVRDLGLGSGLWLVQSVRRSLFSTSATITLTRKQPALPEPKPEPRTDSDAAGAGTAASGGTVAVGPSSAAGYAWPVSGRMTSGFGSRSGRLHAGVDVAVPIGTPVGAARAGTVTHAGDAGGYGLAVYVDHGAGHVTRYGHLSRVTVRRGERVDQGDRIGLSGSTGQSSGPHVHVELRIDGTAVDPLKYLPGRR